MNEQEAARFSLKLLCSSRTEPRLFLPRPAPPLTEKLLFGPWPYPASPLRTAAPSSPLAQNCPSSCPVPRPLRPSPWCPALLSPAPATLASGSSSGPPGLLPPGVLLLLLLCPESAPLPPLLLCLYSEVTCSPRSSGPPDPKRRRLQRRALRNQRPHHRFPPRLVSYVLVPVLAPVLTLRGRNWDPCPRRGPRQPRAGTAIHPQGEFSFPEEPPAAGAGLR